MNKEQESVTQYLKQALELDRLVPVDFSKKEKFYKVSRQDVECGRLNDSGMVDELFESYGRLVNKSRPKEAQIVISLKTVRDRDRGVHCGLLNVIASLDRDGNLSIDFESNKPWIPHERLTTPNGENREIMVGSLHSFWACLRSAELESLLSRVVSAGVKGCLAYADALFSKVEGKGETSVAEQAKMLGCEYYSDSCFIRAYNFVDANAPIVGVYEKLMRDGGKAAHPLYDRMIEIAPQTPPSHVNAAEVDDGGRFLENALNLFGSMGCEFPLADSQRTASHAFACMGEGEVLAVSGPPGTGKTTMLQSIVASQIVRHVLEGRPAPIIVGTSTNNQAVTNIISSFNSVVPDSHGDLDFRWLQGLKTGPEGGRCHRSS